MEKNDDEHISKQVFRIHAYHPYTRHGAKNPDFDSDSGRILDLKNPKCAGHSRAVNYYVERIKDGLNTRDYFKKRNVIGCIVPSHEAGSISSGLHSILVELKKSFPIIYPPNPLVRVKTITKLTQGGPRNSDVHLESIAIDPKVNVKGSMVLLLDDVATTKNSILVCEQKLLEAGATLVLKLALGHTE